MASCVGAGLARARVSGKHCGWGGGAACCLTMRFIRSTAALVALAACATPPAPPAPATVETLADAPPAPRSLQLLTAAGRDNAPTRSEIEHALGQADLARQDGAGAALTYRLQNCALLLLFEADERNLLRLSEAHPSARRAGEAAPSLEQCAAEASAR